MLFRLKSENAELRGLLKEQKSTECKEKESTDASGNSSDGQAELRKSLETLQAKSKGPSKVKSLSKDGGTSVATELIVSTIDVMASPKSHSRSAIKHVAKHGVSLVLQEEFKETPHHSLHQVECFK